MTSRELRYRFFSWRRFPKLKASEKPIDVVIPIIAKDLAVLPLCLEGIRKCVANTVKDIYIVAPDIPEIRSFCEENALQYVNECDVFGYSPYELDVVCCGLNRSGWLFQQFVKLSGKIGTCQHYLCIDADHILIRPHVFLTDKDETVFYMSYENHQPYYDEINRLLHGVQLDNLSYVAHKMLFDKKELKRLHDTISANHDGKPWQQVILDTIDRNEISCFSEFETYGNFMQNKIQRPWLQKRLRYAKKSDYESLRKKYKSGRWSLTFPNYIN